MPLTSPFTTDGFIAYVGDVITTNLTFAVWLVDEFTQQRPVGAAQVMLKDGNVKAPQNLSGYFLFNDLAPGIYTVRSELEFYHPAEETVDTTTLDPKSPVLQIVLKPAPQYPFPAGGTILRGLVTNGEPVVGAAVSVTGKPITTVTGGHGEFVLYFKGIKTETITVVIQKGADTKSITAAIEEGKTVSSGIIHFP
jgi:hypothetical protein